MNDRFINAFKRHREVIMYVICGAATTGVSLVTYYLGAKLFFDTNNAVQLQINNIISWIISVSFAFISNKVLVFKSKASPKKEIVRFYIARIITLIIDMLLMYLLVTVCSANDMLSKCVVQIIVIILNYIFGKLVFTKD